MRRNTTKHLWQVAYTVTVACALWVGRSIQHHLEWLAVPMLLLLVAAGSEVLHSRRRVVPRSLRRIDAHTLRLAAHGQMVAFMMMAGLGSGDMIVRAGLDPYLRNPMNVLQDSDAVRAREAANAFPQRAPEIVKDLDVIRGLIDKSNLSMADNRLRDVDGEMEPVSHSYAKNYADVVDLQKRVAAVHALLAARRQSAAINQALDALSLASDKLDVVDATIGRSRWELASHAWVLAEKFVGEVNEPAPVVSEQLAMLKDRLDRQRDTIRDGFAHHTLPAVAVSKRENIGKRSRRAPAHASREMAMDP